MKKWIFILVFGLAVVALFALMRPTGPEAQNAHYTPRLLTKESESILDQSRITKKPFGLYATPENSPVQPERFSGYHVGADYEVTSKEINVDVPVPAVCDGKLLQKQIASGYGGVIIQSCEFNNEPVTVVYGHLKISSVNFRVGEEVKKGVTLGVLGKEFSEETDGERKHLHLGIRKGSKIDIRGYVQNQSEVSNWIDPVVFVKEWK